MFEIFYEISTKEFRPKDSTQPDWLFLSFIHLHKAAFSSTLARWIKTLLQLAGMNTEIFSAHSLRGGGGAATSAAVNQGISVPEILNMAGWT